MTINQLQDEIIEEFADIDDWMDRYAYIIDMGNTLPPMPEEYKTPQYIIEGCQSRAWLHADITPEGLIHFTADSDAIIVKGIISMLLKVLNDHSPAFPMIFIRIAVNMEGPGIQDALPHPRKCQYRNYDKHTDYTQAKNRQQYQRLL